MYREDIVDGYISTKTIGGKQYVYFQWWDIVEKKYRFKSCGRATKGGMEKALQVRKEYITQHIKELESMIGILKNRLAELERNTV